MSIGEGIALALGVPVAAAVCACFLVWIAAMARAQAEQALHLASGGALDDLGSPPRYKGRCRCPGCRNRPQEPCSDYDRD